MVRVVLVADVCVVDVAVYVRVVVVVGVVLTVVVGDDVIVVVPVYAVVVGLVVSQYSSSEPVANTSCAKMAQLSSGRSTSSTCRGLDAIAASTAWSRLAPVPTAHRLTSGSA